MATIYGLECIENGMVYVGCTGGKTAKRMREHRCLLRQNKHSEPWLQQDFNLYGEAAFRIYVLKDIPEATLEQKREAELSWMGAYEVTGRLYNHNRTSFRPTDTCIAKGLPAANLVEGNKRSPEANMKRRLSQLGIPKGHGAKISATKRARHLMR